MNQDLIETWQIHNRINLYLLEPLEQAQLLAVSASKGRTVAAQFAHLHQVRLMWLQAAQPELLEGIPKFEKENLTKENLADGLQKSGEAIAILLFKAFETGKMKGFKPHPAAFLGYLISHESHHRGQITLSLKQSGCPIDKKISFGLWEWGSR